MFRFGRISGFWAIIAVLSSSPVVAQDTYEEGAIRFRQSFFRPAMITGISEIKVDDPLKLFEARSQEAARLYKSAVSKRRTGLVLNLVGLSVAVFGAALADNNNEDAGLGLIVGGAVLYVFGIAKSFDGRDDLSKSVWYYNGTLERTR